MFQPQQRYIEQMLNETQRVAQALPLVIHQPLGGNLTTQNELLADSVHKDPY